MMENIHSETYSILIDTYIEDAAEKQYPEFLLLNKTDLLRMKVAFNNEFIQFFEKSFEELEKTIECRLHALDICRKTLSKSKMRKPSYLLNTLTNKDLNSMSHDQVLQFCKTKMERSSVTPSN